MFFKYARMRKSTKCDQVKGAWCSFRLFGYTFVHNEKLTTSDQSFLCVMKPNEVRPGSLLFTLNQDPVGRQGIQLTSLDQVGPTPRTGVLEWGSGAGMGRD